MKTHYLFGMVSVLLSACAADSVTASSSTTSNFSNAQRFAGFWDCEISYYIDSETEALIKYQQLFNPDTKRYYSIDETTWEYKNKGKDFTLGAYPAKLVFNKEAQGRLEVTDDKIIQYSDKMPTTFSKETQAMLNKLGKDAPITKLAMVVKKQMNVYHPEPVEADIVTFTNNKLVFALPRKEGGENTGHCKRIAKEKVNSKLLNIKL